MTSKRKLRRRIAELEADAETRAIAVTRELSVGGTILSSTTTTAPWCSICSAFHIPGAGRCTATYTWASPSTESVTQ